MKDKQKQYILVISRVIFGILFLYGGITKLTSGFSAEQFLTGTSSEIFRSLAGNGIVDILVVWGETLIGISLISGTLIKFTAFAGSLMMALFYFASFPLEHGPVTEHIIYILFFIILAIFNAGELFGGDGWLKRSKLSLLNR